MTTFLRTWVHSWNNVPGQATGLAQGQNIIFGLKAFLLARGWTVDASSDSVTASSPPAGIDYWVDSGDLIWGAVAHSWIWLKSPANYPSAGNNVWLLIDLDSANDYAATFSFCTAAPTGSFTTSSSGTKTAPNTFASKQFRKSVLTNAKYHAIGTAIGDFWFLVSHDGTGWAAFALAVNETTGEQAGDNWNVLEVASWRDAGRGALECSNTVNQLNGTTHAQQHWITGAAAAQGSAGGAFMYVNTLATQTTLGSFFDALGDDNTGKYPDPPVPIVSVATDNVSWRGWLIDIRYSNGDGASIQGTVEPVSGPVESAVIGTLWLPATSAPSF